MSETLCQRDSSYASQINKLTVIPGVPSVISRPQLEFAVIHVKSERTVNVGTYEVLTAAQMEALGQNGLIR